jgi:O-antigen ligase
MAETTRELPNRTYIWKDSMNMLKDFPVLGVGLGNFSLAYTLYKENAYWPHVYDHAHNDYIELATETGIVGFALVFWALIAFFRNLYRNEKYFSSEKDPFSYYITIGLVSGMFGMFVHTITEFTFQIPANAYYFTFMLALTASIVNRVSERERSG